MTRIYNEWKVTTGVFLFYILELLIKLRTYAQLSQAATSYSLFLYLSEIY